MLFVEVEIIKLIKYNEIIWYCIKGYLKCDLKLLLRFVYRFKVIERNYQMKQEKKFLFNFIQMFFMEGFVFVIIVLLIVFL